MNHDAGFVELLDGVRIGCEDAVGDLVNTYSKYIRRVARRRLNSRIRPKFDSADVEQAVWASFFKNRAAIPQFEGPQHLQRYLARIAERKVIDEFRRLHSQQHNVDREVASGDEMANLPNNTFRPSEYVRANDLLSRMLSDPEAVCGRIVQMKLKGMTHDEIAAALKIDPKTVQRILRRLESRVA